MADNMDFDTWISERFRELNTDETVFAPYVRSIVEGDESMEEKIDALDGILAELADGNLNVEAFREEILTRWESEQQKNKKAAVQNGVGHHENIGDEGADLGSKLASIVNMADETKASASQEEATGGKGSKSLSQAPDSALRAAILSQYRDESDSDSAGEGPSVSRSGRGGGGGSKEVGGGTDIGLERNTNAERVQNEIKDRREQEKAEAAKKRERDREDRAKQKQQAQDRKEKAKKKSAKVERKR